MTVMIIWDMYSHLCKMYSEVGTLSTTLSGVVVVGGGGLELDKGLGDKEVMEGADNLFLIML